MRKKENNFIDLCIKYLSNTKFTKKKQAPEHEKEIQRIRIYTWNIDEMF